MTIPRFNVVAVLLGRVRAAASRRLSQTGRQSLTIETEAPTTDQPIARELAGVPDPAGEKRDSEMTLTEQLDQARAERVEAARRELREIVARANAPQPLDGERLLGLATNVLNIKPERITAMLAAAGEIAALTWHRSRMLAEVPADHVNIARDLIAEAEKLEAKAKTLRMEAFQISQKAYQIEQVAASHQTRIDELKTRYPEAF